MSERLEVTKTHKLFIGGAFPRSESGRSLPLRSARGKLLAHVSHASRKDLRDAVEAARKAQPGWAGATAYNRGQVLYRLAEMMEARRHELVESIAAVGASRPSSKRPALTPAREVELAIDRVVCFAGWADKHGQVLGANNPVAGPYYNFTAPEPLGVVVVVAPDAPPLLALVSLILPALCTGNAVIAIGSDANPLPASTLAECVATSDVPGGVVNILFGRRGELLPHIATHRDIDGVVAAGLEQSDAATLRAGAAENLKRVSIRAAVAWADESQCHGPGWLEQVVDFKTMWHPSGV
jgi:acyl-CoA reductase-like NAD-dependent aldehyde dehydrogenase